MANVMEEVHLTTIKPKNNVLLLAQEISFAKVLACNDKRLRDRGVRRLKKWFAVRSQGSLDFTRDDYMRIWKGLFYCMWMSDKPLIQEELAEEISSMVHSFATFKASLLFVETFFDSLAVEWFGIDQLRLDKFMMLVRRFVRQSFVLVAKLEWSSDNVQQLANIYQKTLTTAPMGLNMHIIEIFCEELAKVGEGKLSNETVLQFITVFARVMASLKDGRLISQITRCIFLHLIRQTEVGIEHHMKFSLWKEYGFPGGDVDAAERIEVDSEEESGDEEEVDDEEQEMDEEEDEEDREEGIDARAGKVDVLLPPLDFEPQELLAVLTELRNKKETTTKARKTLIQLISKFEKLAEGKYPLGLHKVDLPDKVDKRKEIDKVAKRLYIEERKMIEADDSFENEKLPKNRKAKKKALKSRQTVWEVSETSENAGESSESGCNSSWEVSESIDDDKQEKTRRPEKRKAEEKSMPEGTTNKTKKAKTSPFVVSECKENSYASPIASTPKKNSKQMVLKKTNQNVPSSAESTPQNKTKVNSKKEKRKSIKNQSNSSSLLLNESKTSIESSTPAKENGDLSRAESQENTSGSEKNNGWGGEWEEQPNDVEYEIFIPNKKYVEKRKSLGLSYPVSSILQKSAEKTPLSIIKKKLNDSTPGSQKKVEFNLSANRSQEYREYAKSMRKNQVLFDASKKPKHGLLKNSTPSPINPFYQKKLKLNNVPKMIL